MMIYIIFTVLTFTLLTGYCFLLVYFGRGFSRLKSYSGTHRPTVTVIVPAHNEENTLPHLLKCLSKQLYPSELTEIVLIDDRSKDNTFKIIKTFASIHSNVITLKIKDTVHEISPKKRAITEAVKTSTGEIILTTDADASPGPNWISEMVRAYDENTGMVLGYAPYRTDRPFNTLFHGLLALDYFAMGAVASASVGVGYPTTCNGANLSYRREVFQKVGGFGETVKWLSGDDDLFLHRVRKKTSYQINFAITQDAAVFNNPPKNIREFVRQRIRFASKHLAYPAGMKVFLIGIYALNICLLSLMIGVFFSFSFVPIILISLGVKALFEIIFLIQGQRLLEKRNLLTLYPLAAIPHIFYVVIFPILGQFMKHRW